MRANAGACVAALAASALLRCASFSGSDAERSDSSSPTPAEVVDSGGVPAEVLDAGADARVDPSCGLHERLVEGACVCAPGFARAESACAWSGVVVDPELLGVPPDAWAIDGGTLVDADQGGRVRFVGAGRSVRGALAQTVTLPTSTEIDVPLALSTTVELGAGTFSGELYLRGERSSFWSPSNRSLSSCLGERLLGQTMQLMLSGRSFVIFGGTPSWSISRVDIAPDPSCPLPGEVPNGDFSGLGRWSANSGEVVSFEVASGLGLNGASGARLTTTDTCSVAALYNTVAVPLGNPALEIIARAAPDGSRFRSRIGDAYFHDFSANPVFKPYRMCLPAGLRGLTLPLSLEIGGATPSCGGAVTLYADSVRFVDDPSCAAPEPVQNAHFDEPTIAPWVVSSASPGAVALRSGEALQLSRDRTCDGIDVTAFVDVPVPPPMTGVRFNYRVFGAGAPLQARVYVGGSSESFVAAPPPATNRSFCLPPRSFGNVVSASIGVSDIEGTPVCAESSFGTLRVDDLSASFDATCAYE